MRIYNSKTHRFEDDEEEQNKIVYNSKIHQFQTENEYNNSIQNNKTNLPLAKSTTKTLLPTANTTLDDVTSFGTFSNGYQPKGIEGHGALSKTGNTINVQIGESDKINSITGKKDKVFNKQNVWQAEDGTKWVWDGKNKTYKLYGEQSNETGLMNDKEKQILPTATQQSPELKQQITEGTKWHKEQDEQRIFKAPEFDDGYQFGDVTKTILGTAGDLAVDVGKGAIQLGQGIGKAGAYGVAQIADWTGNDKYAEKVRNRIKENPNPVMDKVEDFQRRTFDNSSILGNRTDQILQSVGYTGTLMGVQGAGGNALNNLTMFLSSTGDSISDTLQETPEAESWQVWLRSGARGGVSVLAESLGGIFGNNKVVGNWENKAYQKITKNMLDGAGKVLSRLGIDAFSEAGEEFIEYAGEQLIDLGLDGISNLIGSDVKFHKDWNWEEVGESMAMAFASTMLLNGSINATKIASIKADARKNGQNISTKEAINMLAQQIDTEAQNELTKTNKSNITQASESNINNFNNRVQQTTQKYIEQAQNQTSEQTSDRFNNLLKNLEDYNNSLAEGQEIFDLNSEENKNEIKAIEKVAGDRNIQISFDANQFKNNTDNAFYNYDENGNIANIVLNPNSVSKKYVQDLVIHELVHSFSGKQKANLMKDVLNYAKTLDDWNDSYSDLRKSYVEKYGENVSEDVINEEAVANILGKKLGSQEFINDLVNGKYATQNRTLVQKIYDFVKNQINRFKGYKNQEQYWKHVKELFDDAYRNSAINKGETKFSKTIQDIVLRNKNLNNKSQIPVIDSTEKIDYSTKNIKRLQEDIKNNVKTGIYKNSATDYEAVINSKTLNKIMYPTANPSINTEEYALRMITATKLPELFKNAVYIDTIENQKQQIPSKVNDIGYHHFVAPINIDGNTYRALISGKESEKTKRLHSLDIEILWQKNSSNAPVIVNNHFKGYAPTTLSIADLVKDVKLYDYIKRKNKNYNINNLKFSVETNDIIQGLEDYSRDEIKQIANDYIKQKLEANDLYDIKLVDSEIHGSRNRGTARQDSDLDIVVEYKGDIREDDLFDILNEDPLEIDGIKVDINPITADKTGTLEEYMKRSNEYDKQKLAETSSIDNQGRKLSKEQQEYFKDSKVRDKDGNLLTVYHGTEANAGIPKEYWFSVFDIDRASNHISTMGDGFYFTDNYERASSYAHSKGNVYEVYLNIINPFIKANNETFMEAVKNINPDYDINQLKMENFNRFDGTKLRKYLMDNGFDGISLQGTYVAFNANQIKNVNNTNPTDNPDIRFSKDTSGAWDNFLDKHFQKEGTGKSIKDMKILPTREITIKDFENVLNEYNIPTKDKKDLMNDLKNVEMNEQSLKDFKDFVIEMNNFYKAEEDKVLNKTFDKEVYKKYINQKYDNTAVKRAKELIPANKQGRRTKEQWLNVAKQIGIEIADKSNSEIEKIAYKSWLEEAPNQKEQLNRQGQGFVKFTADEWLNSIYNSVKNVRKNEQNIKLPEKNVKYSLQNEIKLPLAEQKSEQLNAKETAQIEDKKKIRKHYKSILQSENTTEEAKKIAKELMGSDTYYADSNKRQLKRADERIMSNTPNNELISLTIKLNNGDKITSTDIAVGERLIQYYSKEGDAQKLQEAIQNTAMMGTELGQAVQAMAILNHQTPVGQVSWIQRSVDKMNKRILDKKHLTLEDDGKIFNSKGKDVTNKIQLFNFTSDMQQKILNSTSENMNKVLDEVYAELGNQVAQDLQGQIDAWRYFSMLGNLKTHGRNIIGNTAMTGVQSLKDMVAGGIEDVVSKFVPNMERTKSLTKFIPTSEMIEYAKNDIKNVKNELGIGSDKYNPQSRLQENMRTFKSDIMENTLGKVFDINTNLLEIEDGIGLKFNYVKALSQYMAVNQLTADNITEKQLAKARKYAIQQAQEATFHQANSIATALNQFSKHKAVKPFTDAILPFIKTPLNVAKAGLEYNPVGLVYNSLKGVHDLRNGDITVNQYIDNVSKGLTGSGIAMLGYALAKAGILKASGGDDDKDKYDEEQGKQAYSIQIGNQTYTLDWLAPTAIPLFVGAEANDIVNKDEEEKSIIRSDDKKITNKIVKSGSNLLSAGLSSMNPMTEMSMLSGLASFISSYEQDSNQKIANLTANATKSYINQFVPTLLGQIAKTEDEYQRTTKSTETGILPKAVDQTKNQIMAKIPGLREKLPVTTDIWGNDLKQPENIVQRTAENMLLPYTRKTITTTETDEAINELYDETGSKSVLPRGIEKTFTIEGQTYRMTNQEYAKYLKDYGQTSFDLISQLTSSDSYNDLTVEEQQKAIENIYSYAKESNKIDYADNNDLYVVPSSLYNTLQDLKETGGNLTDYLEFNAKTSDYKDSEKNQLLHDSNYSNITKKTIYQNTTGKKDEFYSDSGIDINPYLDYKANVSSIEADKDSEGKSISGSKKNKVISYINNIKGLNTAQKAMLIRKSGYTSFNDYNQEIITYVGNLKITNYWKKELLEQLGFKVDNDMNISW